MNKLFIGIDVSKDVFDYCFVEDKSESILLRGVLENSKSGIANLYKKIRLFKSHESWVCMEHTGHYGALLASELTNYEIKFSLINPLEIKHSIGMSRGKSDRVDAFRIASYALTNKRRITPYILPSEELQQLKTMMSSRDKYVKINVQLKNGLKALEILNQSVAVRDQIKEHKSLIKRMEKSIAKVEKQMIDIIQDSNQLKCSYDKIIRVIGVGPLTAIKCIVETHNFIKFTNPRKFSCHCGLAPFEYQSGSSIRRKTRTSPLSNKSLKAILYKAAGSAIQHDPQLKIYYNRKLDQGKHKLSVLNAVANKIVLRIFAVQKREVPFVKLAA